MSCNGCRVLRKGCSQTCVLGSCLQWIESSEAQGYATDFLAKFIGRTDLMTLISNVRESQRASLFKSLLLEACGRTINPVSGAVGLLGSGNWNLCQEAVNIVLRGDTPRALTEAAFLRSPLIPGRAACDLDLCLSWQSAGRTSEEDQVQLVRRTPSMMSERSVETSAESSSEHQDF